MKRFLCGILIVCALLCAYFAVFFCFEPYNYLFEHTDIVAEDEPMAYMRAYRRAPSPYIILGDSRMRNATEAELRAASDDPYFNLSFGGASADECVKLFWYANGVTELKSVVFQVSFYNLNADYLRDRMDEEIKQADDPVAFARSFDKHKAAWTRIGKLIKGSLMIKEKTPADAAALSAYAENIYDVCARYSINQPALDALCDIADYCRENGIALRFVAPPMHRCVWDKVIVGLSLEDELNAYKEALRAHGELLDFETPGPMFDSEEYSDGFHMLGSLHQSFLNAALGE